MNHGQSYAPLWQGDGLSVTVECSCCAKCAQILAVLTAHETLIASSVGTDDHFILPDK